MGGKYQCLNEGMANVFPLNFEKYFINEGRIWKKNLKN